MRGTIASRSENAAWLAQQPADREPPSIQQPERPFLRWAGSKRQLVPALTKIAAGCLFGQYVEPFLGSGAMFFALRPKDAALSDVNECLMDTYQAVRDAPDDVADRLHRLTRGKRSYLRLRSLNPSTLQMLDRAARFVFLNRYCFNGLYRTNKSGEFNVPYSPARTGPLPSQSVLRSAAEALRHATLRAIDFEIALRDVEPNALVFLDPPYYVPAPRTFRQYHRGGFEPADAGRLVAEVHRLDLLGAKVILTGPCGLKLAQARRGWRVVRRPVRRSISGFAAHRRPAIEIIATNISKAKQ